MQTHNGRSLPFSSGAYDLRGREAARGRVRGLADRVGQKEELILPRELSVPALYNFEYEALLYK